MYCQMIRVISSPSISTTGLTTFIFAMTRGTLAARNADRNRWEKRKEPCAEGPPPTRRRRRYTTGGAAEKAAPCHSGAERSEDPGIHNHGRVTLASSLSDTFIFVIMDSGLAG